MGTTPSKMGPEAFDCIIEESKRGSCLPASATSTTVWIRSEGHGGASRASTASERVTPASPKCSSGTSKGKDLLGVPSKDSDCNSRNGSRGAIDPKNPVHGKDRQLASRGDGGGSTNRGFGLGAFTTVNWRGLLASGNEGEGEGECSDRGDGDRGSRDSEGTHELDDISAGEKSSGGDDVCWWDTEGEEDKEEEDDEEEEEQGGEFDNSSSNESRGDSRGSRDSSTASQGVSADSDSSWSSASSGARSGSSGSSGPRSGVSRRSTARAGVGSSSARSSRAERRRSKAPASFSVGHVRVLMGKKKVDACAQAGEGALLSEKELMEEKTLAQLRVQFRACLLELGRERFHLEVVKQEEAQMRRQLTSKLEGVIEGLKGRIRDQDLLREKMLDRLEQGEKPGTQSAGRGSRESDGDDASAKVEVLQQSNIELATELGGLRRTCREQDDALRRAREALTEVEADKCMVILELETTRKALKMVLEQGCGRECPTGGSGIVVDPGVPREGMICAGTGAVRGGGEDSGADELENSSGYVESITDEEESQGSDRERAGEPERGSERVDGGRDGGPRRKNTTT